VALVAAGVGVGVERRNPDVVMREIEVKVEREVGLAQGTAQPRFDVLQGVMARSWNQQPDARRAKHATATARSIA
jgi:hypothetical protein